MFLFLILYISMYNSVYGSVLVQYMCIDHSIFIHFLVIVGHKGVVCAFFVLPIFRWWISIGIVL